MVRKIILLSDGTGNGSAKQNKTNVWRLYDALDLHRDEQIAFYDDGVGSQEFLPLKLLGGAFGYGLKANVRQLYKFLCRNYRPGDQLYLFGFSRGAFTIRMLIGMIDYCGVYTDFADEQELEKVARHNYNAFRSRFHSGLLTRLLRTRLGAHEATPTRHRPEIEFVGLWDTVDAYGLPIDGLAKLWDKLIYPLYFPEFRLSKKVKKACHALSVDDERKTFHPVLWDEQGEEDPERIEQVWFPGVHSDVGGGYPEYALSLVPLDWMMDKVESCDEKPESPGLCFISSRRQEIHHHSDWHGVQHDSRALFGAYYRYSPRNLEKLANDQENSITLNKIKLHRSVFERICGNVMPYAPIGLPRSYQVVGFSSGPKEYESPEEQVERYERLIPVWPQVGKRQWLHFAMLMTTFFVVASPWLLPAVVRASATKEGVGWWDTLFSSLQSWLPDLAGRWLMVLHDRPLFTVVLLLLFSLFFYLKLRYYQATQEIANSAWLAVKKKGCGK